MARLMTRFQKSRESGYTLIEVMASIVLLVLIMGILLPFFSQSMSWASHAKTDMTSSQLLTRIAEDVKDNAARLPLDELDEDEDGASLTLEPDDLTMIPSYRYDVQLVITHSDDDANLYLTNIQVLSDKGSVLDQSYVYIKGGESA